MFKRIKEFFERLAYAGLKPQGGTRPQPALNAPQIQAPKQKGFAAFRVWVETRLTKAGPSDPLYLSNRTFGQKLRAWSIIGVPALVVLAGVGLVLVGYFNVAAPIAPPPVGLSNAEIASRMLPDLNKNMHIETQHDLDVEDVHVVAGSPVRLAGIAKNNTDHEIAKVELVFDLTDKTGSRQGAVSTELKNIASKSSVTFQFPIEQATASFALVREVRFQ
jgi:hypothetical protein